MKKYEEQFYNFTHSDFEIVEKQNYDSPWLKYVGGLPVIIYDKDATGGSCLRLQCTKEGGEVKTSAVWTKGSYTFSDGRIEIRARFHGGNSSWPAIWLQHYDRIKPGNEEYYEIDICEYFEKRKRCKTGLFMPKHLKWGLSRLFRPKRHPRINRDGWNVFVCEWDEKHIFISLNGKKVLDYKNNGKPECFPQLARERTFALILSMQYGKKWLKNEKHSQLPLWMDIDYVKYESKK